MPAQSFASPRKLLPVLTLAAALLAFAFGGLWRQPRQSSASLSLPPARLLPDGTAENQYAIRFLSERVKRDPDDFASQNRLAGRYLACLRETGDHKYLPMAFNAARASLRAVPEQTNSGGLTALAQTELASHAFAQARDHAVRLAKLDPGKGGASAIEGDARLELGDYDGAARAFARMRELGGQNPESETRLARLCVLHGQTGAAQKHFATALALALHDPSPSRAVVAWCRWQMGETAFLSGDIAAAERHYRDALITSPDDFRARAGMVRVLAARGDWNGAIAQFNRAILVTPDTAFLATLGDIYHLAGRQNEARAVYKLLELGASPAQAKTPLARLHARLHARQLALFYADHDLHAPAAYAVAKRDYASRRDIYGADALAWTALKAGHLSEAQSAIKAALRLNTQDARLFYHAAMIARAAGDKTAAREFLQRALDLNPHFDLLQAPLARQALDEIS